MTYVAQENPHRNQGQPQQKQMTDQLSLNLSKSLLAIALFLYVQELGLHATPL